MVAKRRRSFITLPRGRRLGKVIPGFSFAFVASGIAMTNEYWAVPLVGQSQFLYALSGVGLWALLGLMVFGIVGSLVTTGIAINKARKR